METPRTLQEAIVYFFNPDNCVAYLSAKRWKDGVVVCPNCGSRGAKYMPSRRVWQCKTRHPKSQFSIKVGTIYEDSAIGLDKWLAATWMVTNCKNGVSSYEIARAIGVTQKSAWFMLHRIRLAMQDDGAEKIGGNGIPVEIDETYIGGKPKNMHKKRRMRHHYGGKAIVMGMLERDKQVRAAVIPAASRIALHSNIQKHITPGADIITDDWASYDGIGKNYANEVINHTVSYVRGQIHTNGIENFWSLLKRGLTGTYINVEPEHLSRYVDQQVFRYNNRKAKHDGVRLDVCVSKGIGKRLTYKELTGKA
jgi:transposase-like protein